jgi:alkylhydroperoxidase family enzyme
MNSCAYCINAHTACARKTGAGERRQTSLAVWRETAFFNDRKRAALAWAESVTQVADTRVPADVWDRVKPQFTPAELVDLLQLVAQRVNGNRIGKQSCGPVRTRPRALLETRRTALDPC